MTYQKIKEEVVDNKEWLTDKELVKLAKNLGLFLILLCLCIGMVTFYILGLPSTVITVILIALSYVLIFDIIMESKEMLLRVQKISRLWWIGIILCVIVYCILSYFNFI